MRAVAALVSPEVPGGDVTKGPAHIALRYAFCMVQLVTRVDAELAAAVDRLVETGEVASRSDAVRLALEALIDVRRRATIGRQIIEGYQRVPETEEELTWAGTSTRRLIEEEPW